MTTADFIALKDYFLQTNPYFSDGYALAFKDDETNMIFQRDDAGFRAVFPLDNKGNYFYFRLDSTVSVQESIAERVVDCGTARITFLDSLIVQMVAIVKEADEWTLINNIRNTAMSYGQYDVIPTTYIPIRELVVSSELSGVEGEEMRKALTNLKSETIVRVTLNIRKRYTPSDCILNPCKSC